MEKITLCGITVVVCFLLNSTCRMVIKGYRPHTLNFDAKARKHGLFQEKAGKAGNADDITPATMVETVNAIVHLLPMLPTAHFPVSNEGGSLGLF